MYKQETVHTRAAVLLRDPSLSLSLSLSLSEPMIGANMKEQNVSALRSRFEKCGLFMTQAYGFVFGTGSHSVASAGSAIHPWPLAKNK
jgi:hypothetical protein